MNFLDRAGALLGFNTPESAGTPANGVTPPSAPPSQTPASIRRIRRHLFATPDESDADISAAMLHTNPALAEQAVLRASQNAVPFNGRRVYPGAGGAASTADTAADRREAVKVYVRLRPATRAEERLASTVDDLQAVQSVDATSVVLHKGPNGRDVERYSFTRVLPAETGQTDVFGETTVPLLQGFLNGRDGLLFAYGMTNAGKTHTIQGDRASGQIGLLPRIIDVIFNSLQPGDMLDRQKASAANATTTGGDSSNHVGQGGHGDGSEDDGPPQRSPYSGGTRDKTVLEVDQGWKCVVPQISLDVGTMLTASILYRYAVWVSYLEVYNENIYDLLVDPSHSASRGNGNTRESLQLKEDQHGRVYVRNLREVLITTPEEGHEVIRRGLRNRQMAETQLNSNSSRSHTMFGIKLVRVPRHQDRAGILRDQSLIQYTTLSVVDLAGSERAKRTANAGQRLREASNINTSLMTFGRCLEALRWNQQHPHAKERLPPFRESKLTRMFARSFTGGGRLVMIVCVSPTAADADETSHVLRFSALASEVNTASRIDMGRSRVPTSTSQAPQLRTAARANERKRGANQVYPLMANDTAEVAANAATHDAQTRHGAAGGRDGGGGGGGGGVSRATAAEVYRLREALSRAETRAAAVEAEVRDECTAELQRRMGELESMYKHRMEDEMRTADERYARKLAAVQRTHEQNERRAADSMLQLQNDYADLKERYDSLRIESAGTRDEGMDLKQYVETLEMSLARHEKQSEAMQRQLELQREQLDSVRANDESAMGDLESDLVSVQQRSERLAEELARVRAELSVVRRQLSEAVGELRNIADGDGSSSSGKKSSSRKRARKAVANISESAARSTGASGAAHPRVAALRELSPMLSKRARKSQSPVLHSQPRGTHERVGGAMTVVLPDRSRVVESPDRKDIMDKRKRPRFGTFEAMQVETPGSATGSAASASAAASPAGGGDSSTPTTTTRLFRGSMSSSRTGKGVSMVLSDIEVLQAMDAATYVEAKEPVTLDESRQAARGSDGAAVAPGDDVDDAMFGGGSGSGGADSPVVDLDDIMTSSLGSTHDADAKQAQRARTQGDGVTWMASASAPGADGKNAEADASGGGSGGGGGSGSGKRAGKKQLSDAYKRDKERIKARAKIEKQQSRLREEIRKRKEREQKKEQKRTAKLGKKKGKSAAGGRGRSGGTPSSSSRRGTAGAVAPSAPPLSELDDVDSVGGNGTVVDDDDSSALYDPYAFESPAAAGGGGGVPMGRAVKSGVGGGGGDDDEYDFEDVTDENSPLVGQSPAQARAGVRAQRPMGKRPVPRAQATRRFNPRPQRQAVVRRPTHG